jgi:hypothetical protein
MTAAIISKEPAQAMTYEQEQFLKGAALVKEGFSAFHISVSGSWSASGERNNGTSVSSMSLTAYEKISHHRGTAELMQGVAISGIKIKDHRINEQTALEALKELGINARNVWLEKDYVEGYKLHYNNEALPHGNWRYLFTHDLKEAIVKIERKEL